MPGGGGRWGSGSPALDQVSDRVDDVRARIHAGGDQEARIDWLNWSGSGVFSR